MSTGEGSDKDKVGQGGSGSKKRYSLNVDTRDNILSSILTLTDDSTDIEEVEVHSKSKTKSRTRRAAKMPVFDLLLSRSR